MKLLAIALGLVMAGTALGQKADSSPTQTGKTASESGPASTQGANQAGSAKADSASELKMQSFKGTLVDAACSGKTPSASPTAQSSAVSKGEADRSTNSGSSCNISSSSGEFALQTKEGRTLRFDAVGNERVKQELLNRKSWTNASTAGKPIQATVSGTQTGDSLMVLTIH